MMISLGSSVTADIEGTGHDGEKYDVGEVVICGVYIRGGELGRMNSSGTGKKERRQTKIHTDGKGEEPTRSFPC